MVEFSGLSESISWALRHNKHFVAHQVASSHFFYGPAFFSLNTDVLKRLQNKKGPRDKNKTHKPNVGAVVRKAAGVSKLPGIQWFCTYRLQNKTWQMETKYVGIVACMFDKYVGIVQRNRT